jgi:hypothetical protein
VDETGDADLSEDISDSGNENGKEFDD